MLPLEKPALIQGSADIAILEQRHKAGYERIPESGEFEDLLNAQAVDALRVSDSKNDESLVSSLPTLGLD